MRRNHSTFIFIVAYLILSGLALAGEKKEKIETNIPFESGGYLNLINQNGNIDISSWGEDKVSIIAYKRVYSSRGGEEDDWLKKIEIDIDQQGDKIKIETHMPGHQDGFFGKIFNRQKISFTVDYEIQVPKKIDLNIQTANGDVDILAIEGRIRLETTNGNIDASRIEGLAKCKTTNGSIRIEFEEVPDEDKMSFVTTNGSIKIYLPDDFGGEFDIKTVNGNIDSDFPISIKGRWPQKHFHGKVNEGNCDLYCSTVNGSIGVLYNH